MLCAPYFPPLLSFVSFLFPFLFLFPSDLPLPLPLLLTFLLTYPSLPAPLLFPPQFCPATPGDSITRKSLFDSLVAGCVPVIFSRASLTQYTLHLTEEQVDEVTVYIPMKTINEEEKNMLDILQAIPDDVLLAKQVCESV